MTSQIDSQLVTIDIPKKCAKVEPFFVIDQKFPQLSDHYGVSAVLTFKMGAKL